MKPPSRGDAQQFIAHEKRKFGEQVKNTHQSASPNLK
jgi:hypothetical protein